jgi:hypothetical protein
LWPATPGVRVPRDGAHPSPAVGRNRREAFDRTNPAGRCLTTATARRTTMTRTHVSALIRFLRLATFAGVLAATGAHATVVSTSQAGGSGGTSFTQTCANGGVLVGLQGAFGDFIDSVKAVCSRIDSIGDPVDTSVLSAHGGGGGTTGYDLRCPRGWAVTGLKGRSGSLVDRIQLVCAPVQLDGTALVSADHTDQFKAGGSGGSSFSIHCGGTRPARGINGGAGSFIDRIGLGCENATLVQVSRDSTTLPDFRAVTRDLPFKVVRNNTVDYQVQMWNVGGVDAPTGSSMDLITNFPISFPTIGFNFQDCDFNNPPPIQGHFLRCFTTRATHPLVVPPMDIEVSFAASGNPGNYTFGGFPNQDLAVRTAGLATTRLAGLKVVDNVGTFELSPTAAAVAPHERLTYTVTWTVPPSLTWRDLQDVQLRVSDDERPVLWVRFNGADGTLRQLNAEGQEVGPARSPGHFGRLQSSDATLYLRDSRVVGSGETGQSVTLSLPVSFRHRAVGRTLGVEVLATGPDGYEQLDIDSAGTLTVTR